MKTIITLLFLVINQIAFSTPTGDSPQDYCGVGNPVIADINIEGNLIYWFLSNDNTATRLFQTTYLTNGATYYAFDSLNSSAVSLAITIFIIEDVAAPIGDSQQFFCMENNSTLADILVYNTETNDAIYWYTDTFCQGGMMLSLTEPLVDGNTYYAYQITENSCCPAYLAITVFVEGCLQVKSEEIDPFILYPNPTKDFLALQFKNKNEKIKTTIYTIYGNKVFTKSFYHATNAKIDVSDLNSGAYFIEIQIKNKLVTNKFIKE